MKLANDASREAGPGRIVPATKPAMAEQEVAMRAIDGYDAELRGINKKVMLVCRY